MASSKVKYRAECYVLEGWTDLGLLISNLSGCGPVFRGLLRPETWMFFRCCIKYFLFLNARFMCIDAKLLLVNTTTLVE